MKKEYFCIALTALMFGSMEVACKLAGNGLEAFQLCFLRFTIGGLMILPVAFAEIKKRGRMPSARELGYCLICGIVGVTVSMVLFQLGVSNCNASSAAVIISTTPIFTMVFAHFILKDRMNSVSALVIALTVAAICFMIRPWDMQPGNTVEGFVFMILAAVFLGLYTVMGKKGISELGAFSFTSFSFLGGCAVLLIVILALHKPIVAGIGENWGLLLYVSIGVTGLGYLSYFTAIKLSDAVTGSTAFVLKMAVAPVIAMIVLHETIAWNVIVGIVAAATASVLNIYNKRRTGNEIPGDNFPAEG